MDAVDSVMSDPSGFAEQMRNYGQESNGSTKAIDNGDEEIVYVSDEL